MSAGTAGGFTKQAARNIFYGGAVFFSLLFIVLVTDSSRAIPQRSNQAAITPAVERGKTIWETRNCIGCHTLLGEGAYYAPELGNVIPRRGADFVKAWIKSQPTGAPGRRQMPQFNLTDQQLDDLVQFLDWTSKVNTEKWPPNIEG